MGSLKRCGRSVDNTFPKPFRNAVLRCAPYGNSGGVAAEQAGFFKRQGQLMRVLPGRVANQKGGVCAQLAAGLASSAPMGFKCLRERILCAAYWRSIACRDRSMPMLAKYKGEATGL